MIRISCSTEKCFITPEINDTIKNTNAIRETINCVLGNSFPRMKFETKKIIKMIPIISSTSFQVIVLEFN